MTGRLTLSDLQSYQERCASIKETGIRVISRFAPLVKNDYFEKSFRTALSSGIFKTNLGIRNFLSQNASYLKNDPRVIEFVRQTALMHSMENGFSDLKQYYQIRDKQNMIAKNPLSTEVMTDMEKAMMDPSHFFSRKAEFFENWFLKDKQQMYFDAQKDFYKALEEIMKKYEEEDKAFEKEQEVFKKEKDFPLINDTDEYFDTDPETFEWQKFLEEVIWKALEKMDKSSPADMAWSAGLILALTPVRMLENMFKQAKEIDKAHKKAYDDNRKKFIDENLKCCGTSREKLTLLLAKEARNWILDNKEYERLADIPKHCYSDDDIEVSAKKLFVDKLKFQKDGSLDYYAIKKSQWKTWRKYVLKYAKRNEWKRKVYSCAGIILDDDELKKIARNASFLIVRGKPQLPKTMDGFMKKVDQMIEPALKTRLSDNQKETLKRSQVIKFFAQKQNERAA